MLQFQQGDEDAFRVLFQKFDQRVVNYAFRFLGSRARAEEVAQDVFFSLFRSRHRYKPTGEFSTWIFRMTHNACLNEVRKSEYQREVHYAGGEWAEPWVAGVEGELAGKELGERIHAILKLLPENQRSALILTRLEGLPYGEAAEVLDCSVPAVKSLIFRATRALRDGLGDYLPDTREEKKNDVR
jgi:RNA polymerase sigma-70 factor (ECF subfamily)